MNSSADGLGVVSTSPAATGAANGRMSPSPSDPLSISVSAALGQQGPLSKSALLDMSPSFQTQFSSSNPYPYKRETSHRVFVNRSLYVPRKSTVHIDYFTFAHRL